MSRSTVAETWETLGIGRMIYRACMCHLPFCDSCHVMVQWLRPCFQLVGCRLILGTMNEMRISSIVRYPVVESSVPGSFER